MPRIEGDQNFRHFDDVDNAHDSQRKEPDEHDRTEPTAYAGGTSGLQRIQPYQDGDSERHDIGFQHGRGDFQTLDGGEYRNCRRNDAVTIKQCRATQAYHCHREIPARRLAH